MTPRRRPVNGNSPSPVHPNLPVPDELLDALAERVADRLAERLEALRPPEPYLAPEEAATYLGCPTSRIYDLVRTRRVRHYRDGRSLRFRREDLDAALTVEEPAT